MDDPAEALAYDAIDHRAVNARFVDDFLSCAARPRRVLDLGVGTGQIAVALAARVSGLSITGVDLSPAMLDVARRNIAAAGLDGRVSLVHADTKALPFAPGSFDAVMSNSLVHHVADVARFFDALAYVAGETAALFVRDLARPESVEAVEALVARWARDEDATGQALFRASLGAALTVDEVRAACDRAGLVDVTVSMTSDRHWTLSRPGA